MRKANRHRCTARLGREQEDVQIRRVTNGDSRCILQEALTSLGHAAELHAGGITITDYDGNPHPHPAYVVVRKTADFLSDFGFSKTSDGRLALVVDEYDQRFRLGPAWMGRLLQTYKERETIAMAKAKGYILRAREVTETSQGPQVRLQFVVMR